MTTEAMITGESALRERRAALQAERPGTRARDAAELLGVSEEALVALDCGHGVRRLRPELFALFAAMRQWDSATALTRNRAVVSEVTGRYGAVEGDGHVCQIVGDPIDLRLFFQHWKHAYAVQTSARGRELRSLQFFDARGEAVHKVYAKGAEDARRFDALVSEFASDDQGTHVERAPRARGPASEGVVDRAAFLAEWKKMENTHDFFGLLRRFGVSRQRALALAEGEHAQRLEASALAVMLERAKSEAVPLMVFVPNAGCVQIRSGLIERVAPMEEWLNVLDPTFNLHVDRSRAGQLWRVEKPTLSGTITSVELFDDQGENVLMVFGLRKGVDRERADWRALALSL